MSNRTPARRQTVRGRNPGKAIFTAEHQRVEEEALAPKIIKKVDGLPYDQLALSPEKANLQKLSTLATIAKVNGQTTASLHAWKVKFDDFPEPKALLDNGFGAKAYLFSVVEVVAWLNEAFKTRRIYGRQKNPRK